MPVIGFHNSHEQVHPTDLLAATQHAEEVGFTAAMSSDHFSPWSERQGQSAFGFSWLGAALATTSLPFGAVNAPGQRYHPAIVAQAIATLGAMFPGRFWIALGSGEASNEHITGQGWPRKELRDARLRECVDVIRALLAGEEVSHDGLVHVDRARLWTRPEVQPALICPAVSVATARAGTRYLAVVNDVTGGGADQQGHLVRQRPQLRAVDRDQAVVADLLALQQRPDHVDALAQPGRADVLAGPSVAGDVLVAGLAGAERGPEAARVHGRERPDGLGDDRRVVALPGCVDDPERQRRRLQCRAEP